MANTPLSLSEAQLVSMANNLTRSSLNLDLIKPHYAPGEVYTFLDENTNEITFTIPEDWGIYGFSSGATMSSAVVLPNILSNTTRDFLDGSLTVSDAQAILYMTGGDKPNAGAHYILNNAHGTYRALDEASDPYSMVQFYKAVQRECVKVIMFIHMNYDLGELLRVTKYPGINPDNTYSFGASTESYVSAQYSYNYGDSGYKLTTDLTRLVLSLVDVKLHRVMETISASLAIINSYFLPVVNKIITEGARSQDLVPGVFITTTSDIFRLFSPSVIPLINRKDMIKDVLSTLLTTSSIKRFSSSTVGDDIKERRKQLTFLAFNLIQKEFKRKYGTQDINYVYPLGVYEYRLQHSPAYDFYIKHLKEYNLTPIPFIINELISEIGVSIENSYRGLLSQGSLNTNFGNGSIANNFSVPDVFSSIDSYRVSYDANHDVTISESTLRKNRVYAVACGYHYIQEKSDLFNIRNRPEYSMYFNPNDNIFLTNDEKRSEFISLYDSTVAFVKNEGYSIYGFGVHETLPDNLRATQLKIDRIPGLINMNKFHNHSVQEIQTLINSSSIIDDYIFQNSVVNNQAYFDNLFNQILVATGDAGLTENDLARLKEYIINFSMFFKAEYLKLNKISEIYFYNPFDRDNIEATKEIISSYPITMHWNAGLLGEDPIGENVEGLTMSNIKSYLSLVKTRDDLIQYFKEKYQSIFARHVSDNLFTLFSVTDQPGGSDFNKFAYTLAYELETAKLEGDRTVFEVKSHIDLLFYLIYDLEVFIQNYVVPIFQSRDNVHLYIFDKPNLDFYINEINALKLRNDNLGTYVRAYDTSQTLDGPTFKDFKYLFDEYVVYSNVNRAPNKDRIKYVSYSEVINKINIDAEINYSLENSNPLNLNADEVTSLIINQIDSRLSGVDAIKDYLTSFRYLFQSYLKTLLFDTLHADTKSNLNKLIKSYPKILEDIRDNVETSQLLGRIASIEQNDVLNNYGLSNLFSNGNEAGLSLIAKSIKFKRFDTIKNNSIKYRREIIDEIKVLINSTLDNTEFLRINDNDFYYDKIYQGLSGNDSIKKYKIDHINMAIYEKFLENDDLIKWKRDLEILINESQVLTNKILINRPTLSEYNDVINYIEEHKTDEDMISIQINASINYRQFRDVLKNYRNKLTKLSYQEVCEELYRLEIYNGKSFVEKSLIQLVADYKNRVSTTSRVGKVVSTPTEVDFFRYKIYSIYSELKGVKDRNPNEITIMDKTISNIKFKSSKAIANVGQYY